ncbi:hypothetical protein [Cellulomonas fimi]|uniref:Uncharacterized protein n=1 Tax=Cellulomonas fimi (strain ATCC 484 / DSM 20113 / JCM 1341 / CCUG 24087 / LMG 16345 / NBRC 15513 / NCIMB 8980 / NCTC 7547 / NRS-133) TaxID=590998 RepID=F4H157_CELFA|nr:hypothetical protein [Cellulomonas fimi]AEE47426.1 hypothetical protein Celf_3312 [Cellulomonas fimi ATCC 484]VEH36184.1 Uncharacterised protein [Cellulomonas fimi]
MTSGTRRPGTDRPTSAARVAPAPLDQDPLGAPTEPTVVRTA